MSADYSISVNPKAAFSMIYQDANGALYFSIEVGADVKLIYLNTHPSENGKMVDLSDAASRGRVELAISRLEMHFKGQGLKVERD